MNGTSRGPRAIDLKTRIAAVVLLLFIASIWLLTYVTTRRLQSEFAEVLANQQFSHVSQAATEIEEKIRLRFDALDMVARDIPPALLADPAGLRRLLENRPVLISLFGNGVVAVSREGVGLADHPALPQRVGATFADLEYFRETMARGAASLGKPRIGRFTRLPGVAFAVPIPGEDSRIGGVLVGYANLGDANLFGKLENAGVGKTGWLAVNDARHRLIVGISDPKRILQPFPPPGVNLMLDRYAAGYEGSGISVNSQGLEVLSSAKQIGKTGWFVQAVLPTEEAFRPIRSMQLRIYVLAALLSVGFTLLVWLVIRRLLRPLAEASAEIRAMASGERELRELVIGQRDEVGKLLESFNILFRQRQVLEEDLERLARTDSLTGLPNRRYFMETAAQELARTGRFGGTLSILMLDLDRFKKVNDTYGHKAGDLVLKKLAETCRATLREVDFTARLGGEEFAVLLPGTDHAAALEVAERLRQAVAAAEVTLTPDTRLRFTASFGVATLFDPAASVDTLLNQADHALYEAKHLGRNRVCGVA